MRKYQIGVMGSAADLGYAEAIAKIAEQIGRDIALSGNICVYGAEKDSDSLSTAAARGAKSAGGMTVGVTYGKTKNDIWDTEGSTDFVVATGIERGGGREFVLVNSCDAVIAVSGGSGTLTELAIAYQSDLPMIVITGTGGWADKLADTYIDGRNRRLTIGSKPENAVCIAIREIKNKYEQEKQ